MDFLDGIILGLFLLIIFLYILADKPRRDALYQVYPMNGGFGCPDNFSYLRGRHFKKYLDEVFDITKNAFEKGELLVKFGDGYPDKFINIERQLYIRRDREPFKHAGDLMRFGDDHFIVLKCYSQPMLDGGTYSTIVLVKVDVEIVSKGQGQYKAKNINL